MTGRQHGPAAHPAQRYTAASNSSRVAWSRGAGHRVGAADGAGGGRA